VFVHTDSEHILITQNSKVSLYTFQYWNLQLSYSCMYITETQSFSCGKHFCLRNWSFISASRRGTLSAPRRTANRTRLYVHSKSILSLRFKLESGIHAALESKTTQTIKCFSHSSLRHLQVLQMNDASLLTKTKAVCHLICGLYFLSKLPVKSWPFISLIINDYWKKIKYFV